MVQLPATTGVGDGTGVADSTGDGENIGDGENTGVETLRPSRFE